MLDQGPYLPPFCVCENRECSNETVGLCRLASVFAGRKSTKLPWTGIFAFLF